jgi:hypothetical protein
MGRDRPPDSAERSVLAPFDQVDGARTDRCVVRATIGWTQEGRPDEEWLTSATPGAPARRRRSVWTRRLPASLSAGVLLVLCGLGVWSVDPLLETWGLSPLQVNDSLLAAARSYRDRPTGWPAAPAEEAAAPLGAPAPLLGTSTSYAFEQLQRDGSPVAYDPCRPVHYVVRTAGEPAGGDELVRAAVATVSQATGLVFVDDGASDEAPSDHRAAYQPDRYGDRWAPVLIAWVDPRLAGDVAGLAGSVAYGLDGGPMVYVTGQVELDAPQLAALSASTGAVASNGDAARVDGNQLALDVVVHELGHLVGLAHVDDRDQLMYPELRDDRAGLADGDRTGLAALGRGACVRQV